VSARGLGVARSSRWAAFARVPRWPGFARSSVVAAALAGVTLAAAAVTLGLVPGLKGRYANGDPALATAYRAKDTCSCLFVMGRDEAFCRAWTVASPEVASVEVDRAARAVTSRALLVWTAQARFVDARSGCVLE
jgi:hypothetical protein